jgi:hypothetical protein
MSAMARKIIRGLGALSFAVAGVTLQTVPAAAGPAPWTWERVVVPVAIDPHGYYSVRAFCPSGFTAVTGGLSVPQYSSVYPNAEYRLDDGSGSSWFVALENPSNSSGSASVVAECVQSGELPPISYNSVDITRGSDGYAEGSVSCPNAGEVVLTGGAGWNNVNSRQISYSGPTWSGDAWIARGWNSVSGAKLTVEVYCVNAADVPGFERIELDYGEYSYWKQSITCPQGKRILNGGTQAHFGSPPTYASYPSITTWTATGFNGSGSSTYLRAWCVSAGTPTVEITGASPGPQGAITQATGASFTFTGDDPAGYPNTFKCSLDGSPPSTCPSGVFFGSLASGSHEFVVWNSISDGRSSGLATYHWTIDTVPPNVTVNSLSRVTLTTSALVRWVGSDQHSGIDHYQAARWLAHANGTSTTWTQPTAWSDLASQSVRTPVLAQGDSICVVVRAYDLAGNVSPWTAPTCTSRPLDDRALTATTGWTRATGSSYWLNTVTRTTATNKTLMHTGIHLSRVGVLATVCPTCGVVAVQVGSTTIGNINLNASAIHHKQVLLLPQFAPRTGTVTVKSVSSGKTIMIDGLVVIQKRSQGPA